MGKQKEFSVFLSYILRHNPDAVGVEMDSHGWVFVEQLIDAINKEGQYQIDFARLSDIVAKDNKGRYRFDETKSKIKACQGHSISWVEPELEYTEPPCCLYHGTTTDALRKIEVSGYISKMERHAVHLQEDAEKAWQSARRWNREPVLLKIDAAQMVRDGFVFGKSDNNVWCTEQVPVKYISDRIYEIYAEPVLGGEV